MPSPLPGIFADGMQREPRLREVSRHDVGQRGAAILRPAEQEGNCQSLVSLTLAQGEVPVPVGLRLFLPQELPNKTCNIRTEIG
jgi:hypothetical protein